MDKSFYFPSGKPTIIRKGVKCWVEDNTTYLLFPDNRQFKKVHNGKTITSTNLHTKNSYTVFEDLNCLVITRNRTSKQTKKNFWWVHSKKHAVLSLRNEKKGRHVFFVLGNYFVFNLMDMG